MSEPAPPRPSTRARKLASFTLVAILVAYGAVVILLSSLERQILFPGTHIDAPASPPALPGESLWLEGDGRDRVEAFYLPAPTATASSPAPLVVITHGNGELIDYWVDGIAPYHRMGVSVLLPEYRGYGRSEGVPGQDRIADDVLEFIERVSARPEVDAARIAYHGYSIGGGVAGAIAARRAPRALVLQSTFTAIADMVFLPIPEFVIESPFRSVDVVARGEFPVLVVHGTQDRVVPYSHGVALSERGPTARLVTHSGGHHQMLDGARYWSEIERLLREAEVVR